MVSHYAPPSGHLTALHPPELDNYDKSYDGEADEVGDVAGDYHAQSAGDEQHAELSGEHRNTYLRKRSMRMERHVLDMYLITLPSLR